MEILWGEEARRSHRASALRPMGEIRSLGRRAAGGIHFRRGGVIPKGVPLGQRARGVPMTSCPDFVDDKQLQELSIAVTKKETEK